MAKKYECDRCGRQFTEGDQLDLVRIPHMDIANKFRDVDLCHRCLHELHAFAERLPQEATERSR